MSEAIGQGGGSIESSSLENSTMQMCIKKINFFIHILTFESPCSFQVPQLVMGNLITQEGALRHYDFHNK